MTFDTVCWIAVAIYIITMVAIGYVTRVRRETVEHAPNFEFWLAKRQLPGWWLATSLTSGWLMLGWIGFGISQIYLYGATGLWILPIPWFILCFIIVAMVPYVRRIAAVSLPQALEKRFGPSARLMTGVFSVLIFLCWTQAELFVGGSLMAGLMHADPRVCMIALALPVAIYTFMGGFRASVMTDVAQFALMVLFMAALTITAYVTASHVTGGHIVDAIAKTATPYGKQGGSWSLMVNGLMFPIILLVGYLPGWMTEQDLLLRIQGAPTTREARKGAVIALFQISIFVILLPAITAFCAIAAFPPAGDAAAKAVGADAMNVIPAIISGLPAFMQVLMLLGIIGCQMSTVDTFANVSALAVAHDLLDPVLKPRETERTRLNVARLTSVLVTIAALGLALMNSKLGDVYYVSSGVLSASIAVPALFAFWRRTTTQGVLAASVVGFVATIAMYWFEMKHLGSATAFPAFLQGAFGYLYVATGVVASTITIVIVSLLTPPPSAAQLAAVALRPVEEAEALVK